MMGINRKTADRSFQLVNEGSPSASKGHSEVSLGLRAGRVYLLQKSEFFVKASRADQIFLYNFPKLKQIKIWKTIRRIKDSPLNKTGRIELNEIYLQLLYSIQVSSNSRQNSPLKVAKVFELFSTQLP